MFLNRENRIVMLYSELCHILDAAPCMDDCTDEENQMYSDMARLKDSMFDAGYTKYGMFSKN